MAVAENKKPLPPTCNICALLPLNEKDQRETVVMPKAAPQKAKAAGSFSSTLLIRKVNNATQRGPNESNEKPMAMKVCHQKREGAGGKRKFWCKKQSPLYATRSETIANLLTFELGRESRTLFDVLQVTVGRLCHKNRVYLHKSSLLPIYFLPRTPPPPPHTRHASCINFGQILSHQLVPGEKGISSV